MRSPSFRVAAIAAGLSLVAATHAAPPADPSSAASAAAAAASAPGSGIVRANMDPAVRPQDDLFDATNGEWVRRATIPADKSSYGAFIELRDRSDAQLHGLVEGLASAHPAPGTDARKVADFYQAYMGEEKIDQLSLAPLVGSRKEIDGVTDVRTRMVLMGRWQGRVALPLRVTADADAENPKVYSAGYRQDGLGLPDRDYYLGEDARFARAREAYLAYLFTLFRLLDDPKAVDHAQDVLSLETAIAKAQWSRVDLRDPKRAYNPTTPAQLATLSPGIEWASFAAAAGLPAGGTIIVGQPSYVKALGGLLKSQKLATWKLYLLARRLDTAALTLPVPFREASFAFHGKAIGGLQEERPRWQLAMVALNEALGEAEGALYVDKYFPPASKARAQALVENLMKAYAQSIDGLAWMSPTTKAAAHDKLSKYGVKIGYPDKWRDYTRLVVKDNDALGNVDRARAFEYARQVVRVGGPVDRGEWGMTPQTVNAYYRASGNEIVFPAAILQPPFFDVQADDAVNYGGIGTVIGHEISHGFDDRGSQYDGDGRLRNWWTDADRKAFDAITGRLAAQYDAYQPLPGTHLNGRLTLGENIADLSGLQISFKAWKLSLAGQPAPVIDGMTGAQRFYFGFAQVWREKVRDERMLESIVTNPHSPGRFRADGASINSDGFHEAFGTKPGDGMWKAPEDRIRLW
jgi:putative endopeptidase